MECWKRKPPSTEPIKDGRWGLNRRNEQGSHHAHSRINYCKPDANKKSPHWLGHCKPVRAFLFHPSMLPSLTSFFVPIGLGCWTGQSGAFFCTLRWGHILCLIGFYRKCELRDEIHSLLPSHLCCHLVFFLAAWRAGTKIILFSYSRESFSIVN